ncbi:MAG: DUF1294 domain-containing protein [Planctomycetes bacterium]|nr:DUF1294 domain-containing protein [Planctomycetota bacterium]
MSPMQPFVWGLVTALNLVTFAVFGFDKAMSRRRGARRIPERTLLWCMFLGGFVGAWIGMSTFRHKTRKHPFRVWAAAASLASPLWLLVWWTW